ncbi:uncharacterized protein LOC135395343 [Ornithodoros turicata]|uniref:uncharacterized protein LOC135395343 n=1 Tax=Ornithodoros turicata TaxID=34597 RepID=UPI00313958C5
MSSPIPSSCRIRWLQVFTAIVIFACLFAAAVGAITAGKTMYSLIPITGILPLLLIGALCLARSRKDSSGKKDGKCPPPCYDRPSMDHLGQQGDGFPVHSRVETATDTTVTETQVKVLKRYSSTDSFSPGQCSLCPGTVASASPYFSPSSYSDEDSEQMSIDPDYFRVSDRTEHRPSKPFECVESPRSSSSSHCNMCGAQTKLDSSADEETLEIVITPSVTSLEDDTKKRDEAECTSKVAPPSEEHAVPTTSSPECFVSDKELEDVPL